MPDWGMHFEDDHRKEQDRHLGQDGAGVRMRVCGPDYLGEDWRINHNRDKSGMANCRFLVTVSFIANDGGTSLMQRSTSDTSLLVMLLQLGRLLVVFVTTAHRSTSDIWGYCCSWCCCWGTQRTRYTGVPISRGRRSIYFTRMAERVKRTKTMGITTVKIIWTTFMNKSAKDCPTV